MKMSIPFLTGKDGGRLLSDYHSEAIACRVALCDAEKLVTFVKKPTSLWIDPGVDGFDRTDPVTEGSWYQYMQHFPNFARFADPAFAAKPSKDIVRQFVSAILDRASKHKPAAISVPQLPVCGSSDRNKINRAMAEAAG